MARARVAPASGSNRFAGLLLLLATGASCDGSPATTPTEANFAQASNKKPAQGNACVTATVNHNPVITAITSDAGRVTNGVALTLDVVAMDPDGDRLAYAWTASCPGTLDNRNKASAVFVPHGLAMDETCVFIALVTDECGGLAQGTLSISSQRATINVAASSDMTGASIDGAVPAAPK